ncbi:hypothetical protein ACFY2V_28035 [Streptomyces eurythermus]|uniref:hypothetical protein n=1 Tax=Streptomyces eurythermus TaxID=42237 RepID=UPI0036AB481A
MTETGSSGQRFCGRRTMRTAMPAHLPLVDVRRADPPGGLDVLPVARPDLQDGRANLEPEDTWYCLMEAYAQWLGSRRWLRLGGSHRAVGDCESGRQVLDPARGQPWHRLRPDPARTG